MVTRRPALVLIATVVGMGIIALPTARLHLALPDDGSGKVTSTKRQAYDLLAGSFGPGFNGPLIVTVSAPPASLKAAMSTETKNVGKSHQCWRVHRIGARQHDGIGSLQAA